MSAYPDTLHNLLAGGLFLAVFFSLCLLVAYLPGLLRDALRSRRLRRGRYGRQARSRRASASASRTTGLTLTPTGTSTASKGSMSLRGIPLSEGFTVGRYTSHEPSRTDSPTRSTCVTVLRRGLDGTDAERP